MEAAFGQGHATGGTAATPHIAEPDEGRIKDLGVADQPRLSDYMTLLCNTRGVVLCAPGFQRHRIIHERRSRTLGAFGTQTRHALLGMTFHPTQLGAVKTDKQTVSKLQVNWPCKKMTTPGKTGTHLQAADQG